jgi:hypothetical protein
LEMRDQAKVKELSDRDLNTIVMLPQHLLCLKCLQGGGKAEFMNRYCLSEKLKIIQENNDVHVTLQAAFDEAGSKTPLYFMQTKEERKRDLDVLQKLGLVPGDTRTARDLLSRVEERIPTLEGICTYDSVYEDVWTQCPLACKGFYEKSGPITALRPPEEMKKDKVSSCREIDKADRLVLRPHHLLCTICFIGSDRNDIPLEEDNLYEVWVKIRENPDIPILITEGPGDCMVCPPCHAFKPERGICVASCHLRDRKKDLDTMLRLGLSPGDELPARELVARIYRSIPTTKGICGYDTDTAPEWTTCQSVPGKTYEKGLKRGVFSGALHEEMINLSRR